MHLRNGVHKIAYACLITLTALLVSTAAIAGDSGQGHDTLSGDEITDLIAGNTVTGTMSSGDGYTGEWSIDADAMCFDYGEGATCYQVTADGQSIQWILDGEVDGTGTVRQGNPMGF